MSVAEFKYQPVRVVHLGKIYRPYALVEFLIVGGGLWVPIEMVVDTGADYTILPKRYLPILGYALKDGVNITTYGIGGPETVYFYKRVKVRLGKWEEMIPVGFIERDDVPALLGRYQFMDRLRVLFADQKVRFG